MAKSTRPIVSPPMRIPISVHLNDRKTHLSRKRADIAPLLDVEDMVRMKKPDWKCVFTYVQSFYRKLRDHENNKHTYMQQ